MNFCKFGNPGIGTSPIWKLLESQDHRIRDPGIAILSNDLISQAVATMPVILHLYTVS